MARIPSRAGRSKPHPEALRHARERARAERHHATDDAPPRRRRRSKSTERSRVALYEAIPEGTRPAAHVAEWAREAKAAVHIDRLRRDARARMHALIDHMATMQGHAPRACTLLLVWDRLAQTLRVHRRTVANMLRRLREAGLLCVVATGRRAEYTPQRDQKAQRDRGQMPANEAAIYGLTVPVTLTEQITPDPTAPESVDGTCTPPPGGGLEDPARAHGGASPEMSRYAAQNQIWRHAARAAFRTWRAQRHGALLSRHATLGLDGGGATTRRALRARLAEMARCLQEHAPDTRNISAAHIASIIRPFALAGWTVADVQHALDWGPDGARHWQAATGIHRHDSWMRARLALWVREDGSAARSFTQARREHDAQVRAQLAADRARAAQSRRTASRSIPADARAALDAIRQRNAERRATERHRHALPVLT